MKICNLFKHNDLGLSIGVSIKELFKCDIFLEYCYPSLQQQNYGQNKNIKGSKWSFTVVY